jgi:CBS domain containing-hemolysin-like protein
VSSAVAAWWANPVSAALLALFSLLLLGTAVTGFVAVVRLGSIQLGGLLSARATLLPGYPRRGEGHASLAVFLLLGVGVAWAVFSLFGMRAAVLFGLGLPIALTLLLSGWFLVIAGTLAVVRGARVEPLATWTLVTLRPWAPLLARLALLEEVPDDDGEEDEAVDEHEVQAFIGVGEEAGILEHEDAELIVSIVEFSDTIAREIMTPRTDVIAVPVNAPFRDVQERFAGSMFTRIPAYRESLDRIEGVVHVKDVLRAVQSGTTPSAGELLRPVLVVPETKPLRDLLREFQDARQQLAVVVDEYGGTSGIVTLEDVLEELVGEIQDEHQREVPDVVQEAEGAYLVRGGAHVEVLEELFGVEVGDVPFDSVAGLVLSQLGHLPKHDEKVLWKGLELEAVEVDRRRLRRVRVCRAAERS